MAHWAGCSVEGELGVLGSLESGMGEKKGGHGAEGVLSRDQLLTDPDQAVDFVRATEVDALAIAMGTSHGAYKFSRRPDGDVLAMNVIEEIHRRLPNTHLVMHGSSSMPQDLQDVIQRPRRPDAPDLAQGVPVEEIQRGIRHGVRKINIDTDNRHSLAMTGQIRRVLDQDPTEFDPRKYLKPAMEAMQGVCRQGSRNLEPPAKPRVSNPCPPPPWPSAMRPASCRRADRTGVGGGAIGGLKHGHGSRRP